jgi:biotin transport system substrate-specific component
MRSRAKRIAHAAFFAVLMIAGAYMAIPVGLVPFTAQTFFVYLSGLVLDPWEAGAGQLLYLMMGAGGMPVFADGGAGAPVLFSPVGGFLLAFPAAAVAEALLVNGRRSMDAIALCLSISIVFGLGVFYFSAYYGFRNPLVTALSFSPFVAWDAVKGTMAFVVARRARAIGGGPTSERR